MGGTYGATAVSCAASVATLEVIQEEKLLDNAEGWWTVCMGVG